MEQANQLPICEAFIMTGESMLKLSRTETDSSHSSASNHTNSMNNNSNTNINNINNNPTTTITSTGKAVSHQSCNTQNNTQSNHTNQQALGGTSESTTKQDRDDTRLAGRRSPIEFKSGLLDRKSVLEAGGKPTGRGRRGWRRVFVTLKDLRLIFRYTELPEEPTTESQQQQQRQHDAFRQPNESNSCKLVVAPTNKQQDLSSKIIRLMIAQSTPSSVKLHHSFAKRAQHYTKRSNVFQVRFADHSEFLMQASSEHEMDSWIEMINFASACLSAPALPYAISSSENGACNNKTGTLRKFRSGSHHRWRSILPASNTRLTYWQQLIDHEERLKRLKQELEEHLNEAPHAKHADKRAKSEFIERIAYLRLEIERYSAYVDLMQKRSNSTEAIILSKHPQNASMAPSAALAAALVAVP